MKSKKQKARIFGLVCLAICLFGVLAGCAQTPNTSEQKQTENDAVSQTTPTADTAAVETQADRMIQEINDLVEKDQQTADANATSNTLGKQSNPYDYTLGSTEYAKLVAFGPGALPALGQLQKSNDKYSAFDRYILAIAMEDIAKVDLKQDERFFWEDADTFTDAWARFSAQASGNIQQILADTSLSDDEKVQKICFYGVLAEDVDGTQLPSNQADLLKTAKEKITASSRDELVSFAA